MIILVLAEPNRIIFFIEFFPEVGNGLSFIFIRVESLEIIHIKSSAIFTFNDKTETSNFNENKTNNRDPTIKYPLGSASKGSLDLGSAAKAASVGSSSSSGSGASFSFLGCCGFFSFFSLPAFALPVPE